MTQMFFVEHCVPAQVEYTKGRTTTKNECYCGSGADKEHMMVALTMTRGLPGSGKSTWAVAEVRRLGVGRAVRVNKDLLRTMLHDGVWTKNATEKQILKARDVLVSSFLETGVDVIVDDTNLAPRHGARLEQLATAAGATFVVRDFTDVSVDECVRRDLNRAVSVGEKVIKDMWRRYLRPVVEPYPITVGLPSAVIVDIDGTVADMAGVRGPFDWAKVGQDAPIEAVIRLVRDLSAAGEKILFVTGRDGSCREATLAWLNTHVGVPIEALIMKDAGDHRPDSVTKLEHFDAHIRGRYNVRFCLDDRDRAVALYRSLGLVVLQVAEGSF